MKDIISSITSFFKILIKRAVAGNITNVSIVVTYYTLLAIVPVVISIGNILPLLKVKSATLMSYMQVALPDAVAKTLLPIVSHFLQSGSGGVASFSGIIAIWAASRGINAMKQSMNNVYGVGQSQGFVMLTIISFITALGLGLIVAILFIVYSFGQITLEYLTPILNLPSEWLTLFMQYRTVVTFLTIFVILLVLYITLPNVHVHLRTAWIGTFVATAGWLFLTQGFSFYIKYFTRNILSYGTIGTFIVLLLWLNFTAQVLLLGSVINATLEFTIFKEVRPPKHYIMNMLKIHFNKKVDR